MFAWNDTTATPHSFGQSDITFGRQLVNDYKALLESKYVKDKVKSILDEKLPELQEIPYKPQTRLIRQTSFIQLDVLCNSPEKAKTASMVTAEVLIQTVTELMNTKRVRIVSEPILLEKPVSPHTAQATGIAFFLGAALAAAVCLLWDFFHFILKDPDMVKAELGLPAIGTIGNLTGNHEENTKYQLAHLLRDNEKYTFNPIIEDFQLLQANIRYSLPLKTSAITLLVTSTIPGEGKTFISSNLAATLAESGKKVLLINCDLRKSTLHNYFNLHRQPGLVNLLLGEKNFDEVVHRQCLDIPLDVICSGPTPPNPVRLIGFLESSGLLSTLGAQYDYIILDSPPCMNMADSFLLGKLVDGILMVSDSTRIPVDAVKQCIAQLQKMEQNILGIVLNYYSPPKNSYAYAYEYGMPSEKQRGPGRTAGEQP